MMKRKEMKGERYGKLVVERNRKREKEERN